MKPADLFAALAGIPRLEGARCRGRWELFDPQGCGESEPEVAERHNYAAALCMRCPALEHCRTWLESLPPEERPEGVIAGVVPVFKKRRPRREARRRSA